MSSAQPKSQSGLLSAPSISKSDKSKASLVSDSIAMGVVFALALTIGQRVVGFGRGILFCKLMDDQQLGQWSMVWSYMMLLAPLGVLGLPGCFGKFSEYYRKRGQLKPFIGRIAVVSIVLTTTLSLVLFFKARYFSYVLFRDHSQVLLVRVLALALIFVSASNFLTSLMESLRQVKTVTWMRFITGLCFAIVGTGLIALWEDGSSAATVGYTASCIVGLIPAVWILYRYRDEFSESEPLSHSAMWQRIAPFAAWLWVSDFLNNLFEVSDRYMLIHWSKTTADVAQGAVGQYHSGRVVPLLMVSVAIVLSGIMLPYLSQAWEEKDRPKAQQMVRWFVKVTALGFTFGGIVILLMAPILFDWILQGRYNGGLAVLPATLVYCIWYGIVAVAQMYLWVAEKGKLAVVATGVGLMVNIVCNMLLIPAIGLGGAVMATVAGNAVLLSMVLMMNQSNGCHMGVGTWICCSAPLLLMFPLHFALMGMGFLLSLLVFTSTIITSSEKQVIDELVRSKLAKIRS